MKIEFSKNLNIMTYHTITWSYLTLRFIKHKQTLITTDTTNVLASATRSCTCQCFITFISQELDYI